MAARTAQIYRKAIDDAVAGQSFDPTLLGKLENLANRGYTDGFFQRHHEQDYQNYLDNHSQSAQQRFVGELGNYDPESGTVEVEVKNHFEVGDELELIMPEGNRTFRLTEMRNCDGQLVDVAPGSGHRMRIPMEPGDYELALLAVNYQ